MNKKFTKLATIESEPLAQIEGYALTYWERCIPSSSGRVGTATVRLPSGKFHCFNLYNLKRQFAEWGQTDHLPREIRSKNLKEISAACPYAVELVRQFDPEALSKPFSLLPARKRKGEDN
jgi:hypothetical protein